MALLVADGKISSNGVTCPSRIRNTIEEIAVTADCLGPTPLQAELNYPSFDCLGIDCDVGIWPMDSGTDILELDQLRRRCAACALHQLCLPAGISGADLERLDSLVRDKRLLVRGKALFHQGDPFRALYIVRSGSIKTFVEDPSGDVQLLGFYLPSEIVGLDGLANDSHRCGAEAMERSSICELPYEQLHLIMNEIPSLHRQLARITSQRAEFDQEHLVMMGRPQSQERLAMFLRGLADRCQQLSRDSSNLVLPMSRRDLASYLGLAMETVSRLFGRMEAEGILAVERKRVRILRPDLLAEMCDDGQPWRSGKKVG